MKRVGIYSGTFDPIHEGHIAFAKQAIEHSGLDKVFFLPEPRPRRKQGIKAFEHRINMLKLQIADEPQLGLIILEQSRFTPRETMPPLLARFENTQLCMLMGDDMLDHFVEWPHVDDLIKSIHFIVGIRKYNKQHVEAIAKTLKQINGLTFDYSIFRPSDYQISSRSIKNSIKKSSDYRGLSPEVANYIRENRLYASTT